jgi:hypothetical protein
MLTVRREVAEAISALAEAPSAATGAVQHLLTVCSGPGNDAYGASRNRN